MQLRIISSAIVCLFAISPLSFAAGSGSGGFKCWTNKQGVRECGNEVPPEYAQGRTETVNKRGMVTGVEERAKSAAEIAEEQRKAEQAGAGSAAEGERKKQEEEQARYDRMLKASFLNEQDIEAARKRKLSALGASIDLTRVTMGKLEEKLKKQEQKTGKSPKPEQQKELDDLKKQIADKHAFIATKEQEKAAVNNEYDGYLKRFRELQGNKAP